MNLAHLSPEIETVFESLDDAGVRTACTPFLIYRGRHRHEVSLEGLMRRAVDATRLKFRHHTWGPTELFYGDLYASREVPCKSTSIPGSPRRLRRLLRGRADEGGPASTSSCSRCPTTTTTRTATAPRRAVESIAKADDCFAQADRGGGRARRLPRRARGDPGRRPRPDRRPPRPAAGRAAGAASGRCCSPPTTAPSWPSSRSARPAAPPTSTCCRARASGPTRPRWASGWPRSRASTWSAGCSTPTARRCTGARAGDAARGRRVGGGRARRRASCASAPAARSPTCAAARWELEGELGGAGGDGRGRAAAQRRLPRPAGRGSGRR